MITLQDRPRSVTVGYWHTEQSVWENGVCVKRQTQFAKFDSPIAYVGLLHGFCTIGENHEYTPCALVEREDGTFDTPSVCCIQLISPTLSGPA